MSLVASNLMAASAAIMLGLGMIHLFYTFHGTKLHPRDAALISRMQEVSPVLTRETTMWRTWIGFNASHSLGAILFGLIYGYLSMMQSALLFQSTFLLAVGLLTLFAYVALAKRYWFSIPYRGIVTATILYAAALLNVVI